jgi:hypothetical protein
LDRDSLAGVIIISSLEPSVIIVVLAALAFIVFIITIIQGLPAIRAIVYIEFIVAIVYGLAAIRALPNDYPVVVPAGYVG